jgi:hypothetical protein
MQRTLKVLLTLNAVLLLVLLLGHNVRAQLPSATNPEGVPFLSVNINPTNVPPMVNINPYGAPPKVVVSEMPPLPPLAILPAGCTDRQNFQLEVNRTIVGPIVLTYLNAPPQTQATLGSQHVSFANSSQLATAMYLRAGQQLVFDKDVMYSGCRPL